MLRGRPSALPEFKIHSCALRAERACSSWPHAVSDKRNRLLQRPSLHQSSWCLGAEAACSQVRSSPCYLRSHPALHGLGLTGLRLWNSVPGVVWESHRFEPTVSPNRRVHCRRTGELKLLGERPGSTRPRSSLEHPLRLMPFKYQAMVPLSASENAFFILGGH